MYTKAIKLIDERYRMRFLLTGAFFTIVAVSILFFSVNNIDNIELNEYAVKYVPDIINGYSPIGFVESYEFAQNQVNFFDGGSNSVVFHFGVLLVFIFSVSLMSAEKCNKYSQFVISIPINKNIMYVAKMLYSVAIIFIYSSINFILFGTVIYTSDYLEKTKAYFDVRILIMFFIALFIQLTIIFMIMMFIGSFTGNIIGHIATAIPVFFNIAYIFVMLLFVLMALGVDSIFDYNFSIRQFEEVIYASFILVIMMPIKVLIIWIFVAIILFFVGMYILGREEISMRGTVYLYKAPKYMFLWMLIIHTAAVISCMGYIIGSNVSLVLFPVFIVAFYILFNKLFNVKIGN